MTDGREVWITGVGLITCLGEGLDADAFGLRLFCDGTAVRLEIESDADPEMLRQKIDARLRELNDDYAVERDSALKDVYVTVLPEAKFMEFMRLKGKIGGQHKFPRVLKGKMLQDWQKFLETGAI